MMGDMGGMMGPGWMIVGGALGLLLALGLLVLVTIGIMAGIRWLIRGSSALRSGGDSDDRALEALRERYARGELGREEFQRIRDDLTKGAGARR
jgi:putative membrane protein